MCLCQDITDDTARGVSEALALDGRREGASLALLHGTRAKSAKIKSVRGMEEPLLLQSKQEATTTARAPHTLKGIDLVSGHFTRNVFINSNNNKSEHELKG